MCSRPQRIRSDYIPMYLCFYICICAYAGMLLPEVYCIKPEFHLEGLMAGRIHSKLSQGYVNEEASLSG